MSTKSTVLYGDKYHFYYELFDNDGIYLQLEGIDLDYEIYPCRATVKIPKYVLRDILKNASKIKEKLNIMDGSEE